MKKTVTKSPTRKGSQVPTKRVHDPEARSLMESDLFKSRLKHFGLNPLPYQQLILHDLFAVKSDGSPFYKSIGWATCRQQGKTESVCHFMLIKTIIFAQSGIYSSYEKESAWVIYQRIVELIQGNENLKRYFPRLPATTLKNDLKPLVAYHPKTGRRLGRMSFVTRKGGTGRGGSNDYVIFDEAQALTRAQFDAFAGSTLARVYGQIIYLGTPSSMEDSATAGRGAGTGGGHYFLKLRERFLKKEIKHASWMEWGVDEITSRDDREAWYRVMPALGYYFGEGKGVTEQTVEGFAGDEESFNVEWLGYWASQAKERAIDITRWRKQVVADPEEQITKDSYLSIAVKSSLSGNEVHAAIAIRRKDGKVFTELLKSYDTAQPWTDKLYTLLMPYLKSSVCTAFYLDGEIVKTAMTQKMQDDGAWNARGNAYRQGKTTLVGAKDISSACSTIITMLLERRIVHRGQELLDAAVEDAKRRELRGNADAFAFESMSQLVDVTPLEAVALAVLGVLRTSRSERSHYEAVSSDISPEAASTAKGAQWFEPTATVSQGFGAFR